MKKVLAVVLAAAFLSLTAVGAFAQIPFVQWYFDANLTQTAADCIDLPIEPSTLQTGHVVAVNFNVFLSSVEYTISYPPSVLWFADVPVNVNQLNIGATETGVASAWALPLNTFSPTPIMRVLYNWNCQGGCYGIQPIEVGPHPTGRLSYVQFGNNVRRDAIGMISLVCPDPIPAEETSWGKVKALYEN
jgi:hypothetical protein